MQDDERHSPALITLWDSAFICVRERIHDDSRTSLPALAGEEIWPVVLRNSWAASICIPYVDPSRNLCILNVLYPNAVVVVMLINTVKVLKHIHRSNARSIDGNP